jgi:probable F420-dependent oxidoreductase
MRVSLGLPTHRVDRFDEFCTGPAIGELAAAAEAAGFDAVFVTDHPAPGDAWLEHGGHHTLDPFVALSFAAAATTTLRLHTNLLVLAYRNPFLSAKAVATLDAASGGRVILGVGAGYLETEFAALGVDFDERNDLTDEAIVTMKAVWTGDSVEMQGRHFDATGNTTLPRPAAGSGPPIWIGGNSRRAIRRAVELADGWSPMPNPAKFSKRRHSPPLETVDDLRAGIEYAHAHAAAVGRDLSGFDVAFMPMGLDMSSFAVPPADAVERSARELEDAGVTYLVTGVPGESRAELLANIERYGAEVLPGVTAV